MIEPRPVVRRRRGRLGLALAFGGLVRCVAPGLLPDRPDAAVPRRSARPSGRSRPTSSLDEPNTTLKIARGDAFALAVKVRRATRCPVGPGVYRFADGTETYRAAPAA